MQTKIASLKEMDRPSIASLFSLQEKVIVVTGGSGVLGTSFVTAISEAGGTVVTAGIGEETCLKRAGKTDAKSGKAPSIYSKCWMKLFNTRKGKYSKRLGSLMDWSRLVAAMHRSDRGN